VDSAEASFKTGREEIAGVLHVATSVGFGRTQVMSRMRTFMRRYPLLRIDIQLKDRFVDLVEEGIDVAFRIGELKESSLIARRIGGFAPQWAPQQRCRAGSIPPRPAGCAPRARTLAPLAAEPRSQGKHAA
jgi:DNA-binding transcriptional LysR family regulator